MRKYSLKWIGCAAALAIAMLSFGAAGKAMAKSVELSEPDYSYGKYVISAKGIGYDGVYDEDSVVFYYIPVEATYEASQTAGKYDIKIISAGVDVNSASAYLEDEYLGTLEKAEFENGKIPFSMIGRPSGTYTITVVAKDDQGRTLYIPFELTLEYTAVEVPDAGAPDTGSLLKSLNISREDYLITGLIIFFVLGIVALSIVMKGKRDNKKRH